MRAPYNHMSFTRLVQYFLEVLPVLYAAFLRASIARRIGWYDMDGRCEFSRSSVNRMTLLLCLLIFETYCFVLSRIATSVPPRATPVFSFLVAEDAAAL